MIKPYKIFIIDDHPLIIDAYTNSFKYLEKNNGRLSFNIMSAHDCKTALEYFENSKTNLMDIVILDISLPPFNSKIQSGEDLGEIIRKQHPMTKLLICTFFSDKLKLSQILKRLEPEGFICKQDLDTIGFSSAILNLIKERYFYSQTILEILKQKSLNSIQLDKLDFLILKELTNGSKMQDMVEIIPLAKSAIDKRKRSLKKKLDIETNSDRDLVLKAKALGII